MTLAPCKAQGISEKSIFPEAHQVHCLAEALWHEARGESVAGQAAVARVVMNRTRAPDLFASTVCKVVYQSGQFSWSSAEKLSYERHQHDELFKQLQIRAFFWMVQDKHNIRYVPDNISKATSFSNSLSQAHHLRLAGVIGHHRFYNNTKYLTAIEERPRHNEQG